MQSSTCCQLSKTIERVKARRAWKKGCTGALWPLTRAGSRVTPISRIPGNAIPASGEVFGTRWTWVVRTLWPACRRGCGLLSTSTRCRRCSDRRCSSRSKRLPGHTATGGHPWQRRMDPAPLRCRRSRGIAASTPARSFQNGANTCLRVEGAGCAGTGAFATAAKGAAVIAGRRPAH